MLVLCMTRGRGDEERASCVERQQSIRTLFRSQNCDYLTLSDK